MKNVLLLILLTGSISSCTDETNSDFENSGSKERPLKIITKILTSRSPHFMRDFTQKAEIGLHITNEKNGTLYKGNTEYRNIKTEVSSINNKQEWHQMPQVYLDSEPATVYAYYPYQKQVNFDATGIPVKIEPDAHLTRNYMYGMQAIGQKTVNNLSPLVLLDMNHALSLLSFQLKTLQERDKGSMLRAIQIGNKAGGTALCFRGEMNIKTGKISGCAGTNASTRLKLDPPEILQTEFGHAHSIMVIPCRPIRHDGDVEILFVIDRKTYTYPIPAQTTWKKGYRYLYQLSFDGKKIILEKVTSREWLPVDE